MRRAFVRALFFALILSFIVSVASCTEDTTVRDTEDEPMIETTDKSAPIETTIPATTFCDQSISEYLGVGFVIENASSQGANIHLENRYGYDVLLGHDFKIVVMNDDGTMEEVPFKENLGVPAILSVSSEVPYLKERYLDFDYYFGGLEPGHYRFLASALISDDMSVRWPAKDTSSDFEEVSLYADFAIVNS
jgi:hypothetical protein